jgi:hypothetical protein
VASWAQPRIRQLDHK